MIPMSQSEDVEDSDMHDHYMSMKSVLFIKYNIVTFLIK